METLNDKQIRAYFLGELSETDAESFEEKYAVSAELTEQVQMVESELADDYLRGILSPSEIHLFEANYLITEARHEKVRLAASLWKIAGEYKESENQIAAVAQSSFWQTIFGVPKSFQIAFAGLAFLLIFGGITFYLLTLNGKQEVTELQDTNQSSVPTIENKNNQAAQNAVVEDKSPIIDSTNLSVKVKENNKQKSLQQTLTPERHPQSVPKKVEKTTSTLAVFVLFSGTLRDDGEQFITIPANAKKVNLQLNLPENTNEYQVYRATLKTADGDTIFTSPNLKLRSLILSAEKLENRTYIIFLDGQNQQNEPESIAEYTFRVRR